MGVMHVTSEHHTDLSEESALPLTGFVTLGLFNVCPQVCKKRIDTPLPFRTVKRMYLKSLTTHPIPGTGEMRKVLAITKTGRQLFS